ncbi:MAG TPA: EAL domain-containing protein [Mycobacteriales bacterium]|nr:EAL domain-containing protein [Mycobacteriales bacterium]
MAPSPVTSSAHAPGGPADRPARPARGLLAVWDRHAVAADLADALAKDELRLHRQPIVDATDGVLVGYEVLVRWRHPLRGLLAPQSFLEVARECGMAATLDAWVVRRACAEAATWTGVEAHLPVSVNLSAGHLADRAAVDMVAAACTDTGLAPARLILEITETSLVPSATRGAAVLTELRALGVQVSLDDFGTGHSSLARLRALPVDEIKIDQSFVRELPGAAVDVAIVRALVALAHELGVGVVAEGVETGEQRDALLALGCPRMQGFLFGHPVPVRPSAIPVQRPTS